jgi:hypothetical protein
VTRKRLYDTIRQKLRDYQLPTDSDTKEVVDAAVDCALDYVLEYAMTVSEQLVMDEAYSEAMVAGMFVNKLKGLLGR